MKRRELLAGIGGASATWPLAARAQTRQVGILITAADSDAATQGLLATGDWVRRQR